MTVVTLIRTSCRLGGDVKKFTFFLTVYVDLSFRVCLDGDGPGVGTRSWWWSHWCVCQWLSAGVGGVRYDEGDDDTYGRVPVCGVVGDRGVTSAVHTRGDVTVTATTIVYACSYLRRRW